MIYYCDVWHQGIVELTFVSLTQNITFCDLKNKIEPVDQKIKKKLRKPEKNNLFFNYLKKFFDFPNSQNKLITAKTFFQKNQKYLLSRNWFVVASISNGWMNSECKLLSLIYTYNAHYIPLWFSGNGNKLCHLKFFDWHDQDGHALPLHMSFVKHCVKHWFRNVNGLNETDGLGEFRYANWWPDRTTQEL